MAEAYLNVDKPRLRQVDGLQATPGESEYLCRMKSGNLVINLEKGERTTNIELRFDKAMPTCGDIPFSVSDHRRNP